MESWCNTCSKMFQNITKFAEEKQFEILNKQMEKSIFLKCTNGHISETHYKKVQHKKCKDCSKNNKKVLKEMLRLENLKYEEE